MGNGKWPLNRAWPLIKGLCEISLRHAGNISFISMKIKRSLLSLVTTESSQKDCVCLNAFMLLSSYLKLLSVIRLLKARGRLIEVKTIDDILIRRSEGWPWLLNKGFINNYILAIFLGL